MDLLKKFIIAILVGIVTGCAGIPSEPGLNIDPKNYSITDIPPGTIAMDLKSKTVIAVRFSADGSVSKLWNTNENVQYSNKCNITAWRAGNVVSRTELPRIDDYSPETAKHLLNNRLLGPVERVTQVYDTPQQMLAALGEEKVPDNLRITIACWPAAEGGPVFIRPDRLSDGCAVVTAGDRTHVMWVLPNWYGAGRINSISLSAGKCSSEAALLSRFGKQITPDNAPPGTYVLSSGKIVAVHRFGDGRPPNKFLVAESGAIITSTVRPLRARDGLIYSVRHTAVDQLGLPSKQTESGCVRDITPGAQFKWRAGKILRYDAAKIFVGDLNLISQSMCK